ncbi:hypothetical protein [Desulfonema magnum]|uniref:Contractile injection system tube protein N-terminal domain-containing protein n=1 Tax=Desulfonema magnum TaxID=45655 RepID=A0A975GQM2_9BACT|nr:hypothetical protein [Desulfonema magnum]QTA89098.1 Uncharacterized protein dnm_051460 [Desulfonema magnum]
MDRISPKLWKGCLVTLPPVGSGVSLGNAVPRGVIFQFNPESLEHSMTARITEKPPIQFKDFPEEEVVLEAHFDATDDMADSDTIPTGLGISRELAALELMLYPGVLSVIRGMALSNTGTIEISELSVPLTLFIWGVKWIVPVQITDVTITEKAFNENLVPIRAEATITFKVLSYGDFKSFKNLGFMTFLTHHSYKELLSGYNLENFRNMSKYWHKPPLQFG